MNYTFRRFVDEDVDEVCNLIAKDLRKENIKDYSKEKIEKIIDSQNKELILKRSKIFHAYVFLDNTKIIGFGMIGPYWDSLTESALFTIFIDPLYKGKGLGKKIIETLEKDEYFLRADRVEICASITAVEFYKHMGYGFKKFGNIVDEDGNYIMEKYPKISNDNSSKTQYNMRPFIDNEYHDDRKKVFSLLNNRENMNNSNFKMDFENFINKNRKFLWMIQLNGENIGIYINDVLIKDNYRFENIIISQKYQGMNIEEQVLNDMKELLEYKKSKKNIK